MRFHKILFQTDAEKQKSFIPKKKLSYAKSELALISKQPALLTDPIFSNGFGLVQLYLWINLQQLPTLLALRDNFDGLPLVSIYIYSWLLHKRPV